MCINDSEHTLLHIRGALMNNMNWDDIRQFLEVLHSGSVTQAAERQGISHTTVSRRISALEKQLEKIYLSVQIPVGL